MITIASKPPSLRSKLKITQLKRDLAAAHGETTGCATPGL
jgi:hypothetical protein